MAAPRPPVVNVIDFRRQRLILEWNAAGGTWTACDVPPLLVHGVALIRASHPNICIFGRDARLYLQIGAEQFELAENSPRIKCSRGLLLLGLRKRFTIESADGAMLYSRSFWAGQGDDFFRWLAARTADPKWRAVKARSWSEGVDAAVLRSS